VKPRLAIFGVKTFPSQGGTDRVAENLILQLKDRFDITLYCYRDPKAESHIPGIKVRQFAPVSKGAAGAFIYFMISALHLLVKGDADIVHVHKTDSAFFIPLLRLRFKVIATSHEAPYKRDKWNAFMKAYFHVVERIFIRSSTLCTCISKPLTEYYRQKYGRDVIFIPNGINPVMPEQFNFERARTFLPEGASMEEPFILFSARRIMKTKGAHTMLEALSKIRYGGQVFIAGELTHNTDYLEALKGAAKSLRVFYLGFVNPLDTLLAFVSKAEIFIFPSETEGMSIMLLEVASAGKPIIASNIPENTQVFSDREVLYFTTADPDDLACKITEAFDEPERMIELGKNAQTKVYTEYRWEDIARFYENVYLSLLKG
jgi:glycosyltransferase involved in cell wall biosynthesis